MIVKTADMNKKLVLLVLLAIPLFAFTQQKPVHEKKMYVSPEGKLFVQGELPLYLWLSTSPDDGAKKYRLKSEETAKYSNPMYFDTDGYNTFRSPSAVDTITRKPVYPLHDIVFEVYGDKLAPSTKIDYGDSKPFSIEGKLFVMDNTQITLVSSDKLSGVETTYYSIDGNPFTKYTQPLVFSEEREYVLKYYAVDNVGNDEEITEIKYFYDKTSPVTTRTTINDEHNNILSARSKIELKAEDKGASSRKIIFSIDGGNEYTYKTPLSAANLSQGEHKLTYYAIDKVGNKETAQNYTFYVDKTAPTIIEEVIAKTFFANGKEYASGKAQLKLTAFDNKAGIKEIRYSINDGDYILYEKPVFLTASAGNLVIRTFAVDNVNNKSVSQTANQKTAIPYIDLSGPTLRQSYSGPVFDTRDTLFINNKTKISLHGYDQEAGVSRIEYRINGKENITYDKPFSLNDEGFYTINFVGYDNVENTSSKSFNVKVDNSGPDINYQFSTISIAKTDGKPNYPKYAILFLSGTDNVVGLENIKYGFGTATPTKIYSTPITGFSTGSKTVKLIATDKLGNKSEKDIEFNILE